jgi:hypothetical protein
MAPEKWGDMTMSVKQDYIRDMELKWGILQYCENHWKANAIATLIYSQWYHTYNKRMKGTKEDDALGDE